MRVLLADDHALLLEGLQNLLEANGIEVAGTAKDGLEAAAQARKLRPDLILMDIRMPRADGLAATRAIKAEMPEVKIIMLTTSTEEHDLFEAVKSGASGYLLKSIDAEALVEALHDAEEDIPPFAPGLAARLLTEFARTDVSRSADAPVPGEFVSDDESSVVTPRPRSCEPVPDENLTQRQLEVLSLVSQGLAYKQVGQRMSLSPRTVKYHMAEITRKLHLENRAQVLAYAGRLNSKGEMEATQVQPPE